MDDTAVGQTTHLAARMEQVVSPGSILLTPSTIPTARGAPLTRKALKRASAKTRATERREP